MTIIPWSWSSFEFPSSCEGFGCQHSPEIPLKAVKHDSFQTDSSLPECEHFQGVVWRRLGEMEVVKRLAMLARVLFILHEWLEIFHGQRQYHPHCSMSNDIRLFFWQRWKKYSLLADGNVPTSVCFGGFLGHMIKTWTCLTKNLKLNFWLIYFRRSTHQGASPTWLRSARLRL